LATGNRESGGRFKPYSGGQGGKGELDYRQGNDFEKGKVFVKAQGKKDEGY